MDRLNHFIDHYGKKDFTVGTLGPSGSSSEAATQFLLGSFFEQYEANVTLYDSFEMCLDTLGTGDIDAAVVPHAYPKINLFYMNPNLELTYMFRMDTPMYGLAARHDYVFHEEALTNEIVLSHPAPVSLMDFYCAPKIKEKPIQYKLISSTSKAAQLVAEGHYNLALTNWNAIQTYNLTFVMTFEPIRMSWSMFTKRRLV